MIVGAVNEDLEATVPLVGMTLLERHSLQIEVIRGGAVTISAFS